MPHLTVVATESQLAGHEEKLIAALTDAVAGVYGEWARPLVVVHLVGIPAGRWAVGGRAATAAAPEVRFGIRAGALARPDWPEVARHLVERVTAAVAAALGPELRESVLVELVPQPDEHVGVGGTLLGDLPH